MRAVFQVFGPIKKCILMPNPETGKHRGYGFIEFDTEQQAEEAIRQMDQFELAGRKLKVGKANPQSPQTAASTVFTSGTAILSQEQIPSSSTIVPGMPTMIGGVPVMLPPGTTTVPAAGTSINITPNLSAVQATIAQSLAQRQRETISAEENVTISGNQKYLLMKKLERGSAYKTSRVVVLRNMVDYKDVDATLESEVSEECSKHGLVERVVIYNEPQPYGADEDYIVKIFVEFANTISSTKAVETLDKRWFGGKLVAAEFYDEELFLKSDFSH